MLIYNEIFSDDIEYHKSYTYIVPSLFLPIEISNEILLFTFKTPLIMISTGYSILKNSSEYDYDLSLILENDRISYDYHKKIIRKINDG